MAIATPPADMHADLDRVWPSRWQAWLTIGLLFLASIVSVIDRQILSVVTDPVRAELAISDVQISLLQGIAFGLFYATMGVWLGLVADRTNRRNLIIFGIMLWSVATLGGGIAANFGQFFVSRMLVGLGEASLSPAAISLIADLFAPGKRGRPIGVFLMGQAVANGIALSFAGERRTLDVYQRQSVAHVFADRGATRITAVDRLAHAGDAPAEGGRLTAPMPGKVVSFSVKAGDRVTRGQPLAVMEAMKMEHTIAAPADGTVEELLYAPGDQVAEGAELLRLAA